MNALVTGATGLLGAHIVRELLRAGHDIVALLRPTSDRRGLAGLPVTLAEGDILDPASLRRAMAGRDVVFHAAAIFTYWGHSAEALDRTAVVGTRHVLESAASAGVRRVILTSSSVIFGAGPRPGAQAEATPVDDPDASPYARAKVHQAQTAMAAASTLGLDLVAACPTLVVGAGGSRLSTSNAVLASYLNDPWRSTFPGGCNIVAARDVARGHLLLAERGAAGEYYLLGGEDLTWRDLHRLISELCGLSGPWVTLNHTGAYLAAAAAEVLSRMTGRPPAVTRDQARMLGQYYWYDHGKAAALGYRPAPARAALLESLRWLVGTEYLNRFIRAGIRLPDPAPSMPAPCDGGARAD
jgi:dihydroflavonol-4-reductase